MTNRVLLGARGSARGMWVSRPGFNVVSTGQSNMLFSTDRPPLQMLSSGSFSASASGGSINISFPNLGYRPIPAVMYGIQSFNDLERPGDPGEYDYPTASFVFTSATNVRLDYFGSYVTRQARWFLFLNNLEA